MKNLFFSLCIWTVLLITAVLTFPGAEAVASEPAADGIAGLGLIGVAGLIDIFDTRTMLEAIEQMKRPANWLRDTFFPRFRQFDTETVDVDIVKGKRRIAPFVSPLAEGKAVDRIGYSTNTLKPGYIKPKMPTNAEDLLKRQPGQMLYSGGQSVQARASAQLGKDLAELMDMIDRREEWMAAKALDLGKITMTIKGETADKTVEIDFSMAADHKITLSGFNLWSDAASDPIADLQAWASKIRQDSGINPTDVVMGGDAAAAFIDHSKVQKVMDLKNVEMGRIDPRQLSNGVSYVGTVRAPGLTVDVWTYEEWYIDEDTGIETSMVPAKKVWMGSTNTANARLYAVIQDIEAIEEGQAAVDRFPKSWVTKDPSVRWLMVQSAPLVTLQQPDAFVSATVLA